MNLPSCRIVILALALFTSARWTSPALGCGDYAQQQQIELLIRQAVCDDQAASQRAIDALRSIGQPAVDAMVHMHRTASSEAPVRLSRAIDAVAGQRDAHASGLFWHTDIASALEEARRTGRPILSLQLLGNLDDDLSCANSRFFRTLLYANDRVSRHLRDHLVLHWQSVRPVPLLTIDFGDGRRIERTITGNSLHYVLNARGEVVDAIPGLYGPEAFLRALHSAQIIAHRTAALDDANERVVAMQQHHLAMRNALLQRWGEDLMRAGAAVVVVDDAAGAPLAIEAARIAPSKMAAEMPAIRATLDGPVDPSVADSLKHDEMWLKIAALYEAQSRLDQRSIELLRAKMGAMPAMNVASAKRRVEDPVMRTVLEFQRSVALDTVRNEYALHNQIHQWLSNAGLVSGEVIGEFTARIYAELFLSPLDDPWMGLAPADAYAALDGNGLVGGR